MIVQGITSTTEAKGNDDEADVDHVAMYLCPVPHKKKGRNTRITQHTQFLCRIESYFGVSSRTWAASVGRVGIGVTAGKFNSVKSSQNSSHWLSLIVLNVVDLPEATKLCLIHGGEDVFIDWGQLRFFDCEGRIKILDVENVTL